MHMQASQPHGGQKRILDTKEPTVTTTYRAVLVSQPGRLEVVEREGPTTRSATYAPAGGGAQPQSPEVRLLKRLRYRTDAVAWAEFVDEYQPVLRAFVRRQGVSAADVPDVVQDILARLVPALARFEFDPSRGRFLTWLWRVTRNSAKNWIRKRVSRVRAEAAWYQLQPANQAGNDAPDERERACLRQILQQVFADVRQTILPAAWACFEGQVLHGRRADELATELGVSRNAVYVNTCRVRARVREQCLRYPIHADWPER
jgi:RNA polymerase sigma-70 factor (ECF subfamily)